MVDLERFGQGRVEYFKQLAGQRSANCLLAS